MSGEQLTPPAEQNSPVQIAPWARPLAIATAIVFCLSALFPAVAAFVKDTDSWPKIWGVLDVAIASVLGILAIAVTALANAKVTQEAEEASYRAYRILIHGIWVLLGAMVLLGDRIVWSNCLPGFAWRTWLLFYALPAWFTCLGGRSRRSPL